eukprot:2795611-Amphidinium_carterae.1
MEPTFWFKAKQRSRWQPAVNGMEPTFWFKAKKRTRKRAACRYGAPFWFKLVCPLHPPALGGVGDGAAHRLRCGARAAWYQHGVCLNMECDELPAGCGVELRLSAGISMESI